MKISALLIIIFALSSLPIMDASSKQKTESKKFNLSKKSKKTATKKSLKTKKVANKKTKENKIETKKTAKETLNETLPPSVNAVEKTRIIR